MLMHLVLCQEKIDADNPWDESADGCSKRLGKARALPCPVPRNQTARMR